MSDCCRAISFKYSFRLLYLKSLINSTIFYRALPLRFLKTTLEENKVKIKDLIPGMENVNLLIRLLQIRTPREITTRFGRSHRLMDGLTEDDSGQIPITFWNDQIEALASIKPGDIVEVRNCFITSFKGEKRINVGRGSEIRKVEEAG